MHGGESSACSQGRIRRFLDVKRSVELTCTVQGDCAAIQKEMERLELQLEQKARGGSGGCVLAASWLAREATGRGR